MADRLHDGRAEHGVPGGVQGLVMRCVREDDGVDIVEYARAPGAAPTAGALPARP